MNIKPPVEESLNEPEKSHAEQVSDWLEENVQVYLEPKEITHVRFYV